MPGIHFAVWPPASVSHYNSKLFIRIFSGNATEVLFHVTVMSLDTIDESSMVSECALPFFPHFLEPPLFIPIYSDFEHSKPEILCLREFGEYRGEPSAFYGRRMKRRFLCIAAVGEKGGGERQSFSYIYFQKVHAFFPFHSSSLSLQDKIFPWFLPFSLGVIAGQQKKTR